MLKNNTHKRICRLFVFMCVLTLGLSAQTPEKINRSKKELPFAENEAVVSLSDGQTLLVQKVGVDRILVNASGFGPFETVRIRLYQDPGMFRFEGPLGTYDARANADGVITGIEFDLSVFTKAGHVIVEAHGFASRRPLSVETGLAPATYGELRIYKNAAPPSHQVFNFTTTNLNPSVFDLIDNSIADNPRRTFFITSSRRETYAITEAGYDPYVLRGVTCCYTNYGGGSPPTITRTGNTISIRMKYPEFVRCTFNNDFVTAAEVTLSGTVATANGGAVSRANVSLTDGQGNSTTVWTNHFGHFSFEGIEAGETCLVEVRHKDYQFESRVITLDDSVAGLDFYPRD